MNTERPRSSNCYVPTLPPRSREEKPPVILRARRLIEDDDYSPSQNQNRQGAQSMQYPTTDEDVIIQRLPAPPSYQKVSSQAQQARMKFGPKAFVFSLLLAGALGVGGARGIQGYQFERAMAQEQAIQGVVPSVTLIAVCGHQDSATHPTVLRATLRTDLPASQQFIELLELPGGSIQSAHIQQTTPVFQNGYTGDLKHLSLSLSLRPAGNGTQVLVLKVTGQNDAFSSPVTIEYLFFENKGLYQSIPSK